MIYFDNAATTRMSDSAINALLYALEKGYGNPSSKYRYGREAHLILEQSREKIASCIGAKPHEIFFTSGGTESDNWAIVEGAKARKRLITSKIEHHAVLRPFKKLCNTSTSMDYLEVDDKGVILESSLKNCLSRDSVFASVMFQNNETGMLQDIPSFAEIIHGCNPDSIIHTDAVQAVGHIPINVHELGIDMMSASAHKFNGPKGIGFLYVRESCEIEPLILGGNQESGMRSGTENVPAIYSMAAALQDNIDSLKVTHAHIRDLENQLLNGLQDMGLPFVINGQLDNRAAGIINIAIEGVDAEGLLNMFDLKDICVSAGSACNSNSQERSHVLRAMAIDDERIDSSMRISLGRYNTSEEVSTFLDVLEKFYTVVLH